MIRIRTMAREDFWKFAEAAKDQGKDLAEVLDRAGVLLTPARQAAIRADVFGEIANTLETQSAPQIMTGVNAARITPADLQVTLARMLRTLEALERGRT